MIKVNSRVMEFVQFPNGETKVDGVAIRQAILESISPTAIITLKYENDGDLLKLMFVKKHIDLSFEKTCYLKMTYMPYSRMDRVEGESVFTLKYVSDFINSLNFKKVEIIEPHSDVSLAVINNVAETYPSVDILYDVKTKINFDVNNDYIYYPDGGAEKRYGKKIKGHKQLVGFKTRDFETGNIVGLEIMGKMEGNPKIIMIDDLCSYGGTFTKGAEKLREMGASEIHLVVGHCEDSIYKGLIFTTDLINHVYTTNSILTNESEAKDGGKLTVYKF